MNIDNFQNSFKESSTDESFEVYRNKSIKNFLIKIKIPVPKLNLDKLQSINYDSEKEFYTDNKDKLKKIKKRFETIE